MKHQDIQAGSIHTPFNWTYADAPTRTAATGFAAGDVGKVALQESDNTLWLLTSDAPVWTQVSGKAAINMTGAWSSSTAYNVGDLARSDDSLWLALQSNTDQAPAEDTYWTLFLSDGSGGSTGPEGPAGAAGAAGAVGASGATPLTATTASFAIASGSVTMSVASNAAFAVGQTVLVADGTNSVHYLITAIGTSTITGAAAAQTGDTSLAGTMASGAVVALAGLQGAGGGTSSSWPAGWVKAAAFGDETNVTLSGEQTIDSVPLVAGDRVLLGRQLTTDTENGVWVVQTGSWTRPTDWATGATIPGGTLVLVGSEGGDQSYWNVCFFVMKASGGEPAAGDIVVDTDGAYVDVLNASPHGTDVNPTTGLVQGIQGVPVSATAPTSGQVLEYNGTEYVPTSPSGGGGGSGGYSGPGVLEITVFAVATSNITLVGTPLIDGFVTDAGSVVLLTGQSNPVDNGLWCLQSGAWVRPDDSNIGTNVAAPTVILAAGSAVAIIDGTDYAGTTWVLSSTAQIGLNAQTWVQAGSGGGPSDATEIDMGSVAYSLTNAYAAIQPASQAPLQVSLPSSGWYKITAMLQVSAGGVENDDIRAKLYNLTASADVGGSEVANDAIPSSGSGEIVIDKLVYVSTATVIQLWAVNNTAARGTVPSATSLMLVETLGTVNSYFLPAISGFSPSYGESTSVTLTGTGFTGATGVSFNGTAGTSVVVVNDTEVTVTSPASFTSGPISVTTPAGTCTSVGDYTPTEAGYTKLLLHMDSGFTDSALSPNTITNNGSVAISSSTYKFGGGSGDFTDSNYLTAPDETWFDFGTGDFTIDFWMYANDVGTPLKLLVSKLPNAGTPAGVLIGIGGVEGGQLQLYASETSGNWDLISAADLGSVSAGQWYHVAVVRASGVWYGYLNGVLSQTITNGAAVYSDSTPITIGAGYGGYDYFNGFIDEFRISSVARWTSGFTPPISAYTAD